MHRYTNYHSLSDKLSWIGNLSVDHPLLNISYNKSQLRRYLSIAQVAERATCSPLTVSRIEKGTPTVSIGIYARVLYALQLDDDLLLIAKEDALGRNLQDLSLKHRQRATKKL